MFFVLYIINERLGYSTGYVHVYIGVGYIVSCNQFLRGPNNFFTTQILCKCNMVFNTANWRAEEGG